MAEFPALAVFTDAWLADTDHLTDVEQGRYWLLIMHMWRAPNRRFPNDDAWLARKFRRSADEVREHLRPVIREFFQCDGNWISHKRLEREWHHVTRKSASQSANAKLRWAKEKNDANAMPSGNAPTPTSTIDSSLRSESEETGADAPAKKTASPQLELVEPEKPPPKPSSRGARLPDDWQPTDDDRNFARMEGLSDGEIDREAGKFRDYWLGKSGAGALKRDWPATWRNWTRRRADERPGPAQAHRAYAAGYGAPGAGQRGPAGVVAASAAILARRQSH